MEKADSIYLFVYGSLMKGKSNHRLLSKSKYIGKAVLEGYGLYQVSSFPGIINKPDSSVAGEVYRIDRDTLKSVDMLEGEGFLYNRELISVNMESQCQLNAFTYIWNGRVRESTLIPFQNQPWKEEMGISHLCSKF